MFKWLAKLRRKISFIPWSTSYVEGSSSIQLVCPHCNETQTHCVFLVLGGERVYTCQDTYDGKGCGKKFKGPL